MLDSFPRLGRLDSHTPIRSCAVDESSTQIPLWSVPTVLIILYVCLFIGLGRFGLVGPDEPRYAAIARAMPETHDWVTPTLWGTPWFEKPVLYYWGAGAAMRIFGESEFAARLPSALAALLAVLAVAWTALRSYGVGAAWYAVLMLPTSVAMIGFSRAASPDMLFAGLLTAAMAVALEMLQMPRPGPLVRVAFGFFLGAAVLAKGPAAVILAGGATLLWAATSRQWRAPFRFLHPLIVLVFCATALPWYVLCALRNPDFLRTFIWQHNFERYLTPIFEHRQPFWFYGPILLLGLLPWAPLLLIALADAATSLRNHYDVRSPSIFLACWAGFLCVFFSFSQSKLPGYILPAIPPVILLVSRVFVRLLETNRRGALLWAGACGALFLLPTIPWISAANNQNGTRALLGESASIVILVAAVGGAIAVLLAIKNQIRTTLPAVAILVTVILALSNFAILPQLNAEISSQGLARQISQADPTGQHVAEHNIPRAWNYGLHYYLGRDFPEWTPESQIAEWIIGGNETQEDFLIRYKIRLEMMGKKDSSPVSLFRIMDKIEPTPRP